MTAANERQTRHLFIPRTVIVQVSKPGYADGRGSGKERLLRYFADQAASVQGNQVVSPFPGSEPEVSVILVESHALVAEAVDFW